MLPHLLICTIFIGSWILYANLIEKKENKNEIAQ
jgi:hypothetical protein